MNPVYDHSGGVVGWLRKENIYTVDVSHAAVIMDEYVYGHCRQHPGLLKSGLFEITRGVLLPLSRLHRVAQKNYSIPVILPIPQIHAIPPILPIIPADIYRFS